MSLWKSFARRPRRLHARGSRIRLGGSNGRGLLIRSCLVAVSSSAVFGLVAVAGFITAPTYPAGPNPRSVAVGDFNGDGIADLAIADYGDASGSRGSVTVLLGNGDGTFQAPQSYPTGGDGSASVVVADFNRDGRLDLAVVSQISKTVSILLGNGDGTFGVAQNFAIGGEPISLVVGDFNGDGSADLAVADYLGGIDVLLGNGDGTFGAAQSYAAGSNPRIVAVGDFNGDGHLDLVTAASTLAKTVSILLGNGDGTFQPAQSQDISFYPSAVATGDFNGDGNADLAVAAPGGTVSILLANGDGTFQAAQDYTTGPGSSSVAVVDLNGDGKLDLAIANRNSNTVSILLGKGDGTFGTSAVSYTVDASPQSVAFGDWNRDGYPDLVVAGGSGVTVLLGKGDGTFQPAPLSYADGSNPRSVAVGDFDGDGTLDFAVANAYDFSLQTGTVSIFLGKGDGTFQLAHTYAVGLSPTSVAVGDFNSDGKLDLVVAISLESGNYQGTVSVLLGNGDGTFQAPQSSAAGIEPVGMSVADLNGDGKLDLVLANASTNAGTIPDYHGTVRVLLGNGDGTFGAAQTYGTGPRAVSVAVADFNGDGILDLAVATVGSEADYKGTVLIFLGNGDGTFQIGPRIDAGSGPTAVVVGDFNGDGKADLVTTNFASFVNFRPFVAKIIESDVRVYLGNGDGTFQATQSYTVLGGNPQSAAIADFNHDGVLDLAVAAGGDATFFPGSTVNILLGNGDGTFQSARSYPAGNVPSFVAAGDFNGDNYPDLVLPSSLEQGAVTVLINTTTWP